MIGSDVLDPQRLAALHELDILDSAPEPGFDDIVKLATRLCDAPVALVSLVDRDRQWFKAREGFSECQTDLGASVCALGLASPDLFIITDLAADPRTQRNRLVAGEPHVRFYAGAPLRTNAGYTLGMLCVLDMAPRPTGLTAEQVDSLRALACQVVAQIELRASHRQRLEQNAKYRQIVQSALDFGIIATDLEGGVIEWNRGAEQVLGWSSEDMIGQSIEAIFTPEDRMSGIAHLEMRHARELGQARDERWHLKKGGERFWASGEMMPLLDAADSHIGYLKILRDRTEQHLAGVALEQAQADLRTAQEAGGIGVFWVGHDSVLHASASFCRLYGLPERETYPSSAFEACVLAEDAHLVSNAEARARGIAPKDVEYRIRRADTGEIRWIARRGEFDHAQDGAPLRFAGAARDITEQIRARDALQRSDDRYRALFTSMDQGFAIVEVLFDESGKPDDWRYVETNSVFGRQTGLSRPVGKTARELMPDIEPFWFDIYGGVARTGQSVRLTDRQPSNGRWFDISAVRIGSEGQHQVGVLYSDITQLKETEAHQAALLKLGDAIRDLLDPAHISSAACALLGETLGVSRVGYGVVDQESETVYIERGWSQAGDPPLQETLHLRNYGAYLGHLQAGHVVVVPDAHQDPRVRNNASDLIESAAAAFVNAPILERGRLVALFYVTHRQPRAWSESELNLIREFGERTRAATERARSNLDREQQAERLSELNANLEWQVQERTEDRNALWQLSRDIMLRARFDGIMTAVNPAWQDVLGWREDELVGHNLLELIHPDDLQHTAEVAKELAQGQSHARIDNRYRRRDGSYCWISWTARPGDGLINAVGRDITEEKDAAEALRRSEEALRHVQKMEAVGQLTGGLAHDFNNLLAGITGALELMSVRMRQGRVKDLERYVATAQGATKRAAALTHRLLAFSRRQTLDPKPTDANHLVVSMEELVRRTIGPEIELEVVTEGGLWTTLIDPPQLENALLNLCLNARDAMPDGGRITIETANEWLDTDEAQERDLASGQYISVCVTDTGTGMTPDVAAKAFDPFFTTKPLGQGTGLGLSMIYGFVRQSGGQVHIRSIPGQGTTMCIYLPRHVGEAERETQVETSSVPHSENNETVLIVDDEPTVRMLVTEVLEDLGYRTLEASDGPAGLRILESDMRVDLLITDVGLPGGLNGRQMADAGRVKRRDLKVLFITGFAENAALGSDHLEPGMEVMTKPFPIDALASRVRELLLR